MSLDAKMPSLKDKLRDLGIPQASEIPTVPTTDEPTEVVTKVKKGRRLNK